jgi:hypothetical protein
LNSSHNKALVWSVFPSNHSPVTSKNFSKDPHTIAKHTIIIVSQAIENHKPKPALVLRKEISSPTLQQSAADNKYTHTLAIFNLALE